MLHSGPFALERCMQYRLRRSSGRERCATATRRSEPVSPICLASTTGSSIPQKSLHRGQRDVKGEGWHRGILCIDDDPVVLSLECALLTAAGFSVIPSGNGVDAVRQFCTELPDAVILGSSLSGTTGAALATRMRRMEEEIPLILNSGTLPVPAREGTLFDRVLPKGVAPGLLVHVLCEIFQLSDNDHLASSSQLGIDDAPRHRDAIDERG